MKNNDEYIVKVTLDYCFVKCPKTGEIIYSQFCFRWCAEPCELVLKDIKDLDLE